MISPGNKNIKLKQTSLNELIIEKPYIYLRYLYIKYILVHTLIVKIIQFQKMKGGIIYSMGNQDFSFFFFKYCSGITAFCVFYELSGTQIHFSPLILLDFIKRLKWTSIDVCICKKITYRINIEMFLYGVFLNI